MSYGLQRPISFFYEQIICIIYMFYASSYLSKYNYINLENIKKNMFIC